MYIPCPKVSAISGAHLVYSTALVFEETFAQNAFAVVSCAVPGLSEFSSPACF